MKRLSVFILCIAAAIAAPALAQEVATRFTKSVSQAEAAPTSCAASGFNTFGVNGFAVTICANQGSLAGYGQIDAYACDLASGQVVRNKALDLPITVSSTSCADAGCTCQRFPDQMVTGSKSGLIFYPVANQTLTTGDAGTVTISVEGWRNIKSP